MLRSVVTAPMRPPRLTTCGDGSRKENRFAQRYPVAQEASLISRGSAQIYGCRKTRTSLRRVSEASARSARSRSIGRDVAFLEVTPIPRPGAGSTDRHWGCRDLGEAEGRMSGGCNVTLAVASHDPIYFSLHAWSASRRRRYLSDDAARV